MHTDDDDDDDNNNNRQQQGQWQSKCITTVMLCWLLLTC